MLTACSCLSISVSGTRSNCLPLHRSVKNGSQGQYSLKAGVESCRGPTITVHGYVGGGKGVSSLSVIKILMAIIIVFLIQG